MSPGGPVAGAAPSADAKLRDSEARFRALAGATTNAIWTIDSAGEVLDALTARWPFLTDLSPRELESEWLAAVHPDDRVRGNDLWRAGIAAGRPFTFEQRVRQRDGSYRHFAVRAVPVRGDDGAIREWVGADIDITERRRAEERLRQSEERLRLGVEVAGFALAEIDYVTGMNRLSAEAARLYGLGEEAVSLPRERVHATFHPDDREAVLQRISDALGAPSEGPFTAEYRIVHPTGEIRWVSARKQIFFDDSAPIPRPTRAMLAVLDVTERKQAEAALRERDEFLRLTLQAARAGAWAVDLTTDRDEWSDEVYPLLGLTPGEVKPSFARFIEAIHPDDRERLVANATAAIAAGVEGQGEYRVVWPDGSVHWILARGRTITDAAGRPRRVGLYLDITERKEAEAEREAFIEAAAHDLRNPLTALKMQAQLLLRRARRGQMVDAAALAAGVAAIDAAASRMVALIDEMMDAAYLRAGRTLALNPAATDVVALARACVDELRRSTTQHAARMETEVPALIGEWDEARLARVLGNLLDNAVKFSPRGGEIVVRVQRQDDAEGAWAVLAVSDQGVGIPAVDLPHLFERFRRGGNVGGIGGAGIGLAGARRIVEQHGGTIAVESVEGQGSTFTVRLPL